MALGIAPAPTCPAQPVATVTIGCATPPAVLVGGNCAGNGLNGGIYVIGNVLDILSWATPTGRR